MEKFYRTAAFLRRPSLRILAHAPARAPAHARTAIWPARAVGPQLQLTSATHPPLATRHTRLRVPGRAFAGAGMGRRPLARPARRERRAGSAKRDPAFDRPIAAEQPGQRAVRRISEVAPRSPRLRARAVILTITARARGAGGLWGRLQTALWCARVPGLVRYVFEIDTNRISPPKAGPHPKIYGSHPEIYYTQIPRAFDSAPENGHSKEGEVSVKPYL